MSLTLKRYNKPKTRTRIELRVRVDDDVYTYRKSGLGRGGALQRAQFIPLIRYGLRGGVLCCTYFIILPNETA